MYCPLVWHFCTPPDTRKIEKIQLHALPIVYTDSSTSYDELLKRSSKDPLHVKRLQAMMLEVYKAINNMSPLLANLFTVKDSVYNIRNGNMLVLTNFKTKTFGFNTFRYQGARHWNSLDNELKSV